MIQKYPNDSKDCTSLDERVAHIEGEVIEIKDNIGQLQRYDRLILDEVERVHTILDRHKMIKQFTPRKGSTLNIPCKD